MKQTLEKELRKFLRWIYSMDKLSKEDILEKVKPVEELLPPEISKCKVRDYIETLIDKELEKLIKNHNHKTFTEIRLHPVDVKILTLNLNQHRTPPYLNVAGYYTPWDHVDIVSDPTMERIS